MKEIIHEFDVKRDLDFVFNNIYNDKVFRKWAGKFMDGLHYEGEIVENTEIEFLDSHDNGVGGEVSRIIPNEYLEFLMEYGMNDGEVEPLPHGVIESYKFSTNADGSTHVIVKNEVEDTEDVEEMNKGWIDAINTIKETLEKMA